MGKFRLVVVLILLVSVFFIWYAVYLETSQNKLSVSALDIGQGDSIFIESPTKSQILVDGGPGRGVLSELGKVMPFYDRSIDLLIVSNPDKDHIAGFVNVLESYKVGAMMIPGTDTDTEIYKALLATAQKLNVPIFEARRGEVVKLGGGAYIQVLFPDRDPSGLDTNTGSIIAKLIYGKTSMLLTGDTPTGVEEYLLVTDGDNLDSDVLKVAHHGSKNSASVAFMGVVSPEYAVISSGAGNSYGHPHKEILDELDQFGVKILRTDELGTVRLVSDGEKFTVE